MVDTAPATISASVTWLDWAVVVGYFIATTIIGRVLSGKQATIRDFFLGGRKLPWYAVSGSIIATEISALTFVGLPYVVFREGGNFTYLQLGLFGALVARLIVGYVLVPAYYRREIYSPYDYIGHRLGEPARKVMTILFNISGLLAQSARVFLTAVVLELILGNVVFGWFQDSTGISTLTWAIWTIGFVAVIWTLMGGIATVIWTDVILFLVFLTGAAVSLGFIVHALSGGWTELVTVADQAGKFRFLDVNPSPAAQYTIWTAVIASTWHNVGAYGTDQLIAQRIFCCRGPRQARWAIVSSYAGILVTVMVMLVGVGLYAYYQAHPLTGAALHLYQENGNRIFPLFIVEVLPPGLTGLLIAAIFAAAISSFDSILAALSQTVMSAFYLPWRRRRCAMRVMPSDPGADTDDTQHALLASRVMVVLWGVVLCLLAQLAAAAAAHYQSILDMGLAMAGYAGGALTAGFLLAFLPLNVDGRGLCWSAPISMATVFATVWHQVWAQWSCLVFAVITLALWMLIEWPHAFPSPRCQEEVGGVRSEDPTSPQRNRGGGFGRTAWLILALGLMLALNRWAYGTAQPAVGDGGIGSPNPVANAVYITVAWPWYSPIGCTVAFVFGYLLARPRANGEEKRQAIETK